MLTYLMLLKTAVILRSRSSFHLDIVREKTVKTIEITISNDDISEFDENFLVNVFFPRNTTANPTSTDILAATGIGTIVDTLVAATTTTLSSSIENLTLVGVAPINGTGNNSSNTLTGNAGRNRLDGLSGNDTLIGGAGADTLLGGAGNDTFIIDALDTVTENSNSGTDTVQVGFNYTLVSNIENLILIGAARAGAGNTLDNLLIGNNLANNLIGGAGNDTLAGGIGRDTLNGGIGNDTYVFDGTDAIVELATGGTDTVEVGFSYVLTNLNLENVTLTGTGSINATGNIRNNTLVGNSNNNVLNGGAGNDILDGNGGIDRLIGGAGDDTYIVDNRGDVVDFVGEATSGGTDTVQSTFSYILGANVERLVLVGSDDIEGVGNDTLDGGGDNDLIIGGLGNDELDGSTGGIDTLIGGLGNDTYLVGLPEDAIVEEAGQGIDTVFSGATTYTISDNVENLILAGGDINGTGNALNNQITGSSGDNVIDGGLGNDIMVGGMGYDTYIVNSLGDRVIENAPSSLIEIDTVFSSVNNYVLTANVENLILTGIAPLVGTGNTLNNILVGNAGNNVLNGGAGNDTLNGSVGRDTLVGSVGNDTYIIDNIGDIITEVPGLIGAPDVRARAQGIDTAQSSISYALAANVENLVLLGTTDLNGTGNLLNNVITGNSGKNTLSGGVGDDILIGGAGNDVLVGQVGNDTLIGGAGADRFDYNTGRAFSAADIGSDRIGDGDGRLTNNDFFRNDSDKIVLGKLTFGLLSAVGNGFSVASEFAAVATDALAKSDAAKIVYSRETGNLFYNRNGVALGQEAIITTLTDQSSSFSLSTSDFIIA